MRRAAIAAGALLLLGAPKEALAQAQRWVAAAGLGVPTTWDDEGLLGWGVALSVGVGVNLTERTTLWGIVDHLPYHRDAGYLKVDGGFAFFGAELERRFGGGAAGPLVFAGAGVIRYADTWVFRSPVPSATVPESVVEHADRYAASTFGAGLDIVLAERVAVRGLLRPYLGYAPTDVGPHLSIRPGAGVSVRW